jgi:uncharacterized membrane protein
MRLASKLCSHGAWIIALVGFSPIVYIIITAISNYQSTYPQTLEGFISGLAYLLIVAVVVGFLSLILFAVGTFLGYMVARDQPLEEDEEIEDDERVEITSLPNA